LDEFGDETSFFYAGATLKMVCVCDPADAIEPFNTKTIFHGYQKVDGSNSLIQEYYTTTDGVVTLTITEAFRGTRFWCQNSQHYLTIPDTRLCVADPEICYNRHCGDPTVCLDARTNQQTYKQVCIKGSGASNRVAADFCRHSASGSTDTAFMEVTQPKVCPEKPANAGGFITKWGSLLSIGAIRTQLDSDWFSEHRIKCHAPVTPQCFLLTGGGKVKKVDVCGKCTKAGDTVTAIVDHNVFRGPGFYPGREPYCAQGKLVCGDGKNFRYYIYIVLQATRFWVADDVNLEKSPVCTWPKLKADPEIAVDDNDIF
jgi:hypothetical protein